MAAIACADARATDQHAIVTILRSVCDKSVRDGGAGRCRLDTSHRSCCSHSSSYAAIYVVALARLAREGGARAAPAGKLALWLTGIALPVRRADLADRPARASNSRRRTWSSTCCSPTSSPICLTLALTKHILRPVTRRIQRLEQRGRARSGIPRSAWSPTSARCGCGTSRRSTTPRSSTRFVHVLEHLTFAAAGALVLVAPALADPLAAAARRPRPGALHGVDEDPRRLPRHPARVLARRCSTTSTRSGGRDPLGPDRRSTTSTWRG